MGFLNIYSDKTIASTLIEINGEELDNLYEFFVKFEHGNLYGKFTIVNGRKKETYDIVTSINENEIENSPQNYDLPLITIQNSSEGICVKHNGVMLSDLVKLYIHIKAKMTNYFPNITNNATDGTELFEAYYVTEISENKYNIVHIV